MAEYIEREALLREIERRDRLMVGDKTISVGALKRFILNRPSADVAPVRHGYWRPILHVGGKTDYECSCCLGIIADVPDDDEHDLCAWCSMCGAKMDGGADNG